MKSTTSLEILGNILQVIAKIPTKHPSQPYLSYLLLDFQQAECIVTAHGVGISCRYSVPIQNDSGETAKIAVDPVVLVNFMSSFQKGMVEFSYENEVLYCRVGNSLAEIKTVSSSEIEAVDPIIGDEWYVGSGADLATMLTRVSFACATTDIRPELSAVYLYARNSMFISVATDSFTLVEYKTPTLLSEDKSVLIPQKYILDIVKIISPIQKCKLILGEGVGMIQSEFCTLIIRTIQGSYPDYEQIIPKQSNMTIEMSRDDIQNALRVIQPFTDAQFPKIELHPDSDSGMCMFITDYNEKGRGTASVRSLCTGDSHILKVNTSSLSKILHSLTVQRIIISCTEGNKPIIITSPEDISFRALLMPVSR